MEQVKPSEYGDLVNITKDVFNSDGEIVLTENHTYRVLKVNKGSFLVLADDESHHRINFSSKCWELVQGITEAKTAPKALSYKQVPTSAGNPNKTAQEHILKVLETANDWVISTDIYDGVMLRQSFVRAVKNLLDQGLVESKTAQTGTQGKPPKAYRLKQSS